MIKNNVLMKHAVQIAKHTIVQGDGGLIVIGKVHKSDFERHYPLIRPSAQLNLKNESALPVLKKLAELDGALAFDGNGKLMAFGARLLPQEALMGKGTRHSAAKGVTKKRDCWAVLASQEDAEIKIFENGLITQTNKIDLTANTDTKMIVFITFSMALLFLTFLLVLWLAVGK